jgi:hypothetical protein
MDDGVFSPTEPAFSSSHIDVQSDRLKSPSPQNIFRSSAT